MPKRDAVFNFRYKMKYPGRGAYHFPTGASHIFQEIVSRRN